MHEFSLMADLLRKIEELARRQQAQRVVCVRVRLGALSHISPAHFREHFVHGAAGTCAEGARLEVETSDDPDDPHAQDILLRSIDVA
ncbi:MAG: hydrogenase maturation nickel metallochaperone HypA [Planctomycetota bacterium]|nr:MAG: hydrogenase maturation nickel metallochaperone HypA [Planctomycetota bacterium]